MQDWLDLIEVRDDGGRIIAKLLDFLLRAAAKSRMVNDAGASPQSMGLRRVRTPATMRCFTNDIGLLFDAWADMEDVLLNLSPEEMLVPHNGGSAFGWTVGHTAHILDAWINVRFQGHHPHPVIGDPDLAMGGSGVIKDWDPIHEGTVVVREDARAFLSALKPGELDVVISYAGSILPLRDRGVSLRYAVLRNAVHHYYHIGEIATTRARLGHQIPPVPGPLAFYAASQER